MRQNVALVALSALSVAAAQNNTFQNFTINTNSIGLSERSAWCTAELNTCGILCAGNPLDNACDPSTLIYSCDCQNGSAPGLQYYTQTMYTFTCQEAFSECIQANANDAQGQKNCTDNIQSKCGTLDPNKADISSGSTTSAAPSGSTTPTGTGATGTNSAAATPTSSKNAGPTAAVLGNGAAVLAMGVLAAALL